jgi:hypothetical protein
MSYDVVAAVPAHRFGEAMITLQRVLYELEPSKFTVYDDRGGTNTWKIHIPSDARSGVDAQPIDVRRLKKVCGESAVVTRENWL